jgi:hypothetical protein
MWPVVMLAAQLLSKQEQQQDARRQEYLTLEKERAARLGGNPAMIEEGQFENKLKNATYASPKELATIYGSGKSMFGGDDDAAKSAVGSLPSPSALGSSTHKVNSPDFALQAPANSGIRGGTQASLGGDSLSLDDDDPYALSAVF